MAPKTRNPVLIPGVSRFGRSSMYHKRRLYKKKAVPKVAKKVVETTKVKKVGGAKNGGERKVALKRVTRFHNAEPTPIRKRRDHKATPAKLRSKITPGTVLILLAGRFRGKRVVFLKQLASGLLLVNGPFKINGVPLRRVNQAYVIASSTKIDISGVKIDEKFNDKYFKRPEAKSVKDEKEFFTQVVKKTPIEESRIADQKAADKALLEAVKKTPHLKAYLSASFTLHTNQAPHALKF